MATPILNITELTAAQSNKTTTANQMVRDLEGATNGFVTITVVDGDNFLKGADATEGFFRFAIFDLTGSPTAEFNVIVKEASRIFFMRNSTNESAQIRTGSSAGAGVTIAAGAATFIASDGTDLMQQTFLGP